MTQRIKIGGVPEHFNIPWHLGIESNRFRDEGIELIWRDFPGGTGAMTKALRNGEIDMAVLLTEGIIKDIANGNKCRIVQFYVESPLIWGIHVKPNGKIQDEDDLSKAIYAISRNGSGSHLMSFIYEQKNNRPVDDSRFNIVGGIEGAVESINKDESHAILWEKFMTQPYVDQGKLERLGEILTPWPCFAIAVKEKVLSEWGGSINKVLSTVNSLNREVMNDKDASCKLIAKRYNLKLEKVREWFELTQWTTTSNLNVKVLEKVIQTLKEFGLIENESFSFEDVV